jgi:hypothetical protein
MTSTSQKPSVPAQETAEQVEAPSQRLKSSPDLRQYVGESGSRSMSLDSREDMSTSRDRYIPSTRHPPQYSHHGGSTFLPPRSPEYQQHPRYPTTTRRLPNRQHVQSVVTSSFSVDEDRDDAPRMYRRPPAHAEEDEREEWMQDSHQFYPPSTPSPKRSPVGARPLIQRAFSSAGYFVPPENVNKRSYYHHSIPISQYHTQLPPEFMPPSKRPRMEPTRREIIVSPREDRQMMQRNLSYPTPQHWPSSSHHDYGPPPPSPHQSGTQMVFRRSVYPTPSSPKFAQVSPASESEDSSRSWSSAPHWAPTPRSRHPPAHFWESPRERDHAGSYGIDPYEQNSRSFSYSEGSMTPRRHGNGEAIMGDPSMSHDSGFRMRPDEDPSKPLLLLSMPQDRVSLSETLCVVRENIEVFRATQGDVDAPAPGRKHAVVVGQVGLRCIHCRHTTKCSDRVKRAVCYPSSIKRIYRTVIDMKLDHFTQCKFVPIALKKRLDELKAVHSRSTGTTMQYFIQAAHYLGMEDGSNGVILREHGIVNDSQQASEPRVQQEKKPHAHAIDGRSNAAIVTRCDSISSGSWISNNGEPLGAPRIDTMSSGSFEALGSVSGEKNGPVDIKWFEAAVSLALPEDETALSPLRCFLREQVCAFSATENDIAVRAPTTFSIAIGQGKENIRNGNRAHLVHKVGIGCIHCVKQSAKHRSNRAVCFPFSIGRIYQSVADIQRFHFGECKMMPTEVKDRFLELQSASSKGSKGLATRQYWVTSAKKIGLVDTAQGIRFGRDPNKPEAASNFSLDILAQAAFSVTTANKQLVLPEDKESIAEFLYVVIEQLQPCRFTEADRNKRRLKDVGCIGVECKHCAGKVDSRKFFWSSVSAVESNFVSVHTHMLECKFVPQELKDKLVELKKLRKEQTAALRSGSQKAFFARVWQRLHVDECSDGGSHESDSMDQVDAKDDIELNSPGTETENRVMVSSTDGEMVPI